MGRLATAQIRTSHGVKGFMKVHSYSGEQDHLLKLKEVTLKKGHREKQFLVEQVRPCTGGVLLKLSGIDSPEDARSYNSWELWVDREQAAKLDEQEFYYADLFGMAVLCEGEEVAQVISVSAGGTSELLELEREGRRFFVPFIDQFIGEVSLEDRTIILKDRRLLE